MPTITDSSSKAVVLSDSVAATGSIGTTTVVAKAVTLITTPTLTITVTAPEVIAKAVVPITSVTLTSYLGEPTTRTENRVVPVSVPLRIYNGGVTVDAQSFDYEAIKDSYESDRVIYLVSTDRFNTRYVSDENRVIIIQAANTNRTVYVAA